MRQLYSLLFTEYPGPVGFGPAVITLAIGVALCGALVYGGVIVGKAVIADAPVVQSGHS